MTRRPARLSSYAAILAALTAMLTGGVAWAVMSKPRTWTPAYVEETAKREHTP